MKKFFNILLFALSVCSFVGRGMEKQDVQKLAEESCFNKTVVKEIILNLYKPIYYAGHVIHNEMQETNKKIFGEDFEPLQEYLKEAMNLFCQLLKNYNQVVQNESEQKKEIPYGDSLFFPFDGSKGLEELFFAFLMEKLNLDKEDMNKLQEVQKKYIKNINSAFSNATFLDALLKAERQECVINDIAKFQSAPDVTLEKVFAQKN